MSHANFKCNVTYESAELDHFWEHTVGSSHATMALRADWQKQLTRCKRELGFRHVRFHGLLSDDMGTLVNEENALVYSFFNADQICDFLLSIGMQYTHAAVWMIMAFAKLGDTKRVWELLNIINPVNHGKSAEEIATYKVEPYVLAADVYSRTPHAGHGGWTWYTGSAVWLYRLITESFLGLKQEGNKLRIAPCVPKEWKTFNVHYRYKKSMYHIEVMQINIGEDVIITVEGLEQIDQIITLSDDGAEHSVHVASVAII